MYEEYRRRCKAEPRRFNLGDCWLWKADDQPWVFNLGTQEGYWRARASYEAIEAALRRMREQADAEGITSIAIPRIGVGYGGLSWKKVRAIVEAVFADWPGTLVVYEEFVAGGSADAPESQAGPPPCPNLGPRRGVRGRAGPLATQAASGECGRWPEITEAVAGWT